MLNNFYKAAFFMLISTAALSQDVSLSVISAQGNFDVSENISLEWTVGESIIETVNTGKSIITQGFHQTFNDRVLNVDDVTGAFAITIYPNPVSAYLFVHFESIEDIPYLIRLFDIHGRILNEFEIVDPVNLHQIDISHLSSGVYLVRIYDAENPIISSQRIIKL